MTDDKNNGGPAFPYGDPTNGGDVGMNLRDYFAAKAMQSLIINPETISTDMPLSARAYELADAMLRRRSA